ncbi:MAG: hypothetical protein MI723_01070, partial [Caulobacterales bacterium]|nr:hypothetical protein [Caulobacterales bacterium]
MMKALSSSIALVAWGGAAFAQELQTNDSRDLKPGDIVPGTDSTLASFAEEVAQHRERARGWTVCPDWDAVRAETNTANDQAILERTVDTVHAASDLGDVD